MLKEMNGVKFSREILEPPVPTVSAPREDTDATKNVFFIVSMA
jgi:hypothetical protein